MSRSPVGVVSDSEDDLYVICDDGTLWKLDAVSLEWRQVGDAIPDTEGGEEPSGALS